MSNGESKETLRQLRSDIRDAMDDVSESQVRYLVDVYYQLQEYRKRAANQARAGNEADEHIGAIVLVLDQFEGMEGAIKSALDRWTDNHPMGKWAKNHTGVGPVIAAGLIAHIDPHRAQTAGAVWRFAGLDPTLEWKKGQKRPYNARLKVLAWKLSDSFVKQRGREDCFYGHEYARQKQVYVDRNESGAEAETAKKTLEQRTFRDKATREIYESGKLPDGRVDLRARRWVAKLFLAHFWQAWREELDLPVPEPYPIAHLGHSHRIDAPE